LGEKRTLQVQDATFLICGAAALSSLMLLSKPQPDHEEKSIIEILFILVISAFRILKVMMKK